MERKAFKHLHDIESSWWYRARAAIVEHTLARYLDTGKNVILDLGAGYGGMCASLSQFGDVDALEPDKEARTLARERGYRNILDAAEAEELPAGSYTLIALLDVLEHTEDDAAFLLTLHRTLANDGALVVTVPAFEFLWSTHDEQVHHYRRYTKKSLTAALLQCGFKVEFMSYWNMLLFFPALIVRTLGLSGQSSLVMPSFMNSIIEHVVKTESSLLPRLHLPLGTGIIAYAKKIDNVP